MSCPGKQWTGSGPLDTDSAPSRPRGNVGISFSGRGNESIGSRRQRHHTATGVVSQRFVTRGHSPWSVVLSATSFCCRAGRDGRGLDGWDGTDGREDLIRSWSWSCLRCECAQCSLPSAQDQSRDRPPVVQSETRNPGWGGRVVVGGGEPSPWKGSRGRNACGRAVCDWRNQKDGQVSGVDDGVSGTANRGGSPVAPEMP